MNEQDTSNFSTSSSHRLPTISASQALQNAASRKLGISTSLPNLDQAFRSSFAMSSSKGLPRGQLTEVYGPPGVGKTAFAMQLASNALHEGDCVVWIDTGAPMPGPRFEKILKSHHVPAGQNPPSSPPVARSIQDLLEHFTYLSLRTLPHLLVMFLHPTAKFPPEKTALIVIDNVSSPFATAFLRSSDAKISTLDVARKHRLQWAANRKWAVAGDLASAMNKMAALKNMAIVVINQVATSLKGVKRAMLKPAISGAAWETAIHNQVVLWRDFAPGGSALDLSTASSVRLAEVVKAGGKIKPINSEAAVPFIVGKEGLQEIKLAVSPTVETPPPIIERTKSTKRKADEIADSDEEADELGSDDDFGLPDDDIFDEAVRDEGINDQNGSNEPG